MVVYDSDAEWLEQKGIHLNENALYDFSERVSIAVIDGGVELERARNNQLRQIEDHGSKT